MPNPYFFRSLGLLALATICLSSCSQTTDNQQEDLPLIAIVNNDSLNRPDEPVVVSRAQLTEWFGEIPTGKVPQLFTLDGRDLPSQTDDLDGDGTWDELALVCSLAAYDSLSLELNWVDAGTLPAYPARTAITAGRMPDANSPIAPTQQYGFGKQLLPYQANQMDGPAWENDKVGYRIYLDGRNARDVFGKKVPYMVLQKVGDVEGKPTDNYHVMADWGRDVLPVGNSLGAGGIGLYHNGQLVRLGILRGELVDNVDSTRFEFVQSGPVRSILKLHYFGWEAAGEKLDVHHTISIWAGSHSYRNEMVISGAKNNEVELVTGLPTINNQNPLFFEEFAPNYVGLGLHDKNTYEREFFLGLGLILSRAFFVATGEAPKEGKGITQTYFARFKAKNNEPITYHVLSGWELEDEGYSQSEYFYDLLRHEAARLNSPVAVVKGRGGKM